MVDRARIRCPVCRFAVPVTLLWAAGDVCPRCSQPLLYTSARRARTADARSNTTAVPPPGHGRVFAAPQR